MKISTVIVLLLLPMGVVAQNPQGMSEADMQNMKETMQKMQSCMEKIDKQQFKALEQRQHQFESEMRSLCASGKRDEAQKKAILFAEEMTKDAVIKAVSKCGELAKGMMPQMPFADLEEVASNEHVCDAMSATE